MATLDTRADPIELTKISLRCSITFAHGRPLPKIVTSSGRLNLDCHLNASPHHSFDLPPSSAANRPLICCACRRVFDGLCLMPWHRSAGPETLPRLRRLCVRLAGNMTSYG